MIAATLRIDNMAIHKIIDGDLRMRKIWATLVPKVDEQKQTDQAISKNVWE